MTLTCLIPAYNEAPRLGAVLETVLNSSAIDRILVVDDASMDGTANIARQAGVEVLAKTVNEGKTSAVIDGLKRVTTPHVMLLDADLVGLDGQALDALAAPVLSGQADVSISLRKNAPKVWHLIGIDYISGERVLPTEFLQNLIPQMQALPKFGLEVFMNRAIIAKNYRLAIVEWPHVSSPLKAKKLGWKTGIKADFGMIIDIFDVVTPLEIVRQIRNLKALTKTDQ